MRHIYAIHKHVHVYVCVYVCVYIYIYIEREREREREGERYLYRLGRSLGREGAELEGLELAVPLHVQRLEELLAKYCGFGFQR